MKKLNGLFSSNPAFKKPNTVTTSIKPKSVSVNKVKAQPIDDNDEDWKTAIQKTLKKGDELIKNRPKSSNTSKAENSETDRVSDQEIIENRHAYFTDNVILTLAPAISFLGRAAYNEACKSFTQEAPPWHECTPMIQVRWCNVALAAVGAFSASPYKPLISAPHNPNIVIYIWYEGQWRHAVFSSGNNKKPMWYMRDGFSIPANDKQCANIVYMQLEEPSFGHGMEGIIDKLDNEPKVSNISNTTTERPSKISREVRSPAPANLPKDRRFDKPETEDYYPAPSYTKNLKWKGINLSKPETGNTKKTKRLR